MLVHETRNLYEYFMCNINNYFSVEQRSVKNRRSISKSISVSCSTKSSNSGITELSLNEFMNPGKDEFIENFIKFLMDRENNINFYTFSKLVIFCTFFNTELIMTSKEILILDCFNYFRFSFSNYQVKILK